jgi:cytochrome c556
MPDANTAGVWQGSAVTEDPAIAAERIAFTRELVREEAEFLPVRRQMRRLITLGIKAGRDPFDAATVGQVAKACRREPADVVRLIERCGDLMGVTKDEGRIENWIVWEDGE